MLPYSIVIATLDRPRRLRDTLASIATQSHLPAEIIVIDASSEQSSHSVCLDFSDSLPLTYQKAHEPSAAKQRNQGAALVSSPLIAFTDDDVVLAPDVFHQLASVFDQRPDTGAVAARMHGFGHHRPRGLLRLYYRFQAGYNHPTWGAKLFGPGINCLPCYEEDAIADDLIPAQWLPAGVIVFHRPSFESIGRFPNLTGYSFMEDVIASARVARLRPLYFHTSAWYDHFPSNSSAKRDRAALARMRLANRRLVASEFLNLHGPHATFKFFLLRLFDTLAILRQRPPGWPSELRGTWL